ncbi:hypothetical protein [Dyella sp. C11]|uniref:hypothetical protein n=1 Tax=Dyella sp. C11 TaxID=2126991 RepID=UPI0018E56682|nr:hypothetical protein [Dyella sp. C11]
MAALLESLRLASNEHPDVSLTHESGWSISAFRSGIVWLENIETGDGPWHMRGLSFVSMLELWVKLAEGHIESLLSLAWVPGYAG